jgi:hypothetical protein
MSQDKLKAIALAHEFHRCRDSFELFVYLSSLIVSGAEDRQLGIRCYNAYVDFVSQLYEFYLGFGGGRKGRSMDLFINDEVRKLLKIKRDRILRGDAPSWENHISYYEVELPAEFAYNFRTVRNLRSHADSLRASFDLSEFFKKYHKFVHLLYEEPHWLWSRENVKEYDWLQIERFAKTLSEKRT